MSSPYRQPTPKRKPNRAGWARVAWAHVGRGLALRLYLNERRKAARNALPVVHVPVRRSGSSVGIMFFAFVALSLVRAAAGPTAPRSGSPVVPFAPTSKPISEPHTGAMHPLPPLVTEWTAEEPGPSVRADELREAEEPARTSVPSAAPSELPVIP
ncbi:MAG: hypothetical protein HOW73_01130 [Polyangiaceae bacterium]|nr:hypothetical protein [Polyangiaceae bacterium]